MNSQYCKKKYTIKQFFNIKNTLKMSNENLEIKKVDAIKAYNEADSDGKKLLQNLFGKKNLFNGNIKDIVKTFEDALEISGKTSAEVLPYSNPKNDAEEALNAYSKIFIICSVLNEGWVAELHNTNQYKYYPYFKQSSSGSGLSYCGYDYWSSVTYVGVRLAFKSSELAEYAGKQFIDIYSKFII